MGRFESSICRAWVTILVLSQGGSRQLPWESTVGASALVAVTPRRLEPIGHRHLKAWYGSLTLHLLFVAVMPRCVHVASDIVATLRGPGYGCSRKKRSISRAASGPRGSV